NDPLAVYEAVKEAHDRAMNGEGPTLIEAMVHRMTAHSSDDNHLLYRNKQEIEEMKKTDPLVVMTNYLYEAGLLTEEKEESIREEIDKSINEATDYADAAPYAEPEDAIEYVYEQ